MLLSKSQFLFYSLSWSFDIEDFMSTWCKAYVNSILSAIRIILLFNSSSCLLFLSEHVCPQGKGFDR